MVRKFLSVKRDDDAEALEEYYKDPELGNYALRLPRTMFWGGSMGQSASLTQFVITWAMLCSNPSLKLYLSDDSQSKDIFLSSLYGLSAVYFSNLVSASDSERNIRQDMLGKARPRIDAMWKQDFPNVAKRRAVELVSVVGAKREFLPSLYARHPTLEDLLDRQSHGRLVRSPMEMTGLFVNCTQPIPVSHRGRRLISPLWSTNLVGKLLHEAFRNTAEHGYLKKDGRMPNRGLRSVIFKIHSINKDRVHELSPFSIASANADKYFDHVTSLHREYDRRKNIDFLEISVLDSGPGFAATMRQVAPDLNEMELVARCFENTSSSKLGANSGLGLTNILSVVRRLNGFIRVRTCTCEASFFAVDESGEGSNLQPKVNGTAATVAGTLLTVCVPIMY